MFDDRKQTILGFFFVIGLIYLLRLLYLQVIDDTYQTVGSTNAIKREVEVPLRGQVYDRNGKLLVANVEVYDMYVTPRKVKEMDTLSFCRLFGIDRAYFDSTLAQAIDFNRNKPSLFLRQLSKEDYSRVADAMINYQGFTFEQSFFRTYPAHTMANALGYIGEISKENYEKQTYYRRGDYVGLSGLEKQYEMELRGQRGVKFVMVNVRGEEKGSYQNGRYDTLSVIGKNFYSTIDADVQQLTDSLMQNKAGSLVAIEPSTGEILAFGSYPTYDPNALSGRQFSKIFRQLSLDPDKPLVNRALSGFYRPGSTFKLVQSLVALKYKAVDPFSPLSVAGAPMKCHNHGPSHYQNMHNGIQHSCNPYFYSVFRKFMANNDETSPFKAVRVGMDEWTPSVAKFGFGQRLGIDLPGETRGLLPDIHYYDKVYGVNQWKFSNIYSLSIGEGEIAINMLKLANEAAAIANRGYWITPHLAKGISKIGAGIKPELIKVHNLDIDAAYFEIVVGGMQDVVEAGTGRSAMIPGLAVCGKTGTSQNKVGKDNGIFICFAPRENPKIAVACMVENSGFGATVSAPIASLIVEKYLFREIKRRALAEKYKSLNVSTVAALNSPKKSNVSATEEEGSEGESASNEQGSENQKGLKVERKPKPAPKPKKAATESKK